MIPDPEYDDVVVVSDDHPPPAGTRTDQDVDSYLNLQSQGNGEQAYLGPVSGDNGEVLLSDDQRHDNQSYLNPIPSNHDAIQSQHLTPLLPEATANPYSTPYDHLPSWQKILRSKINKPR